MQVRIIIRIVSFFIFASLSACSTTRKFEHGDVVVGGKAIFRHNATGMNKLDCTECHDKLYTNTTQHKKQYMEQIMDGDSCGICHNGKKSFSVRGNCNRCHRRS